MGLETTHDCWHGSYHSFMRWRQELARAAGLPPLLLMEGFFRKGDYLDPFVSFHNDWPDAANEFYDSLPIKWDSLKEDPFLYHLLSHSDCEGEIEWQYCQKLANRLEELLPKMPKGNGSRLIDGDWQNTTKNFISGLMEAFNNKENVEFH